MVSERATVGHPENVQHGVGCVPYRPIGLKERDWVRSICVSLCAMPSQLQPRTMLCAAMHLSGHVRRGGQALSRGFEEEAPLTSISD